MIIITRTEQDEIDKINRAALRGLLSDRESDNRRWNLAYLAYKERLRPFEDDHGYAISKQDRETLLAELCDSFGVSLQDHLCTFKDALRRLHAPPHYPIWYNLFEFEALKTFSTIEGQLMISGQCIVSIMDCENEIPLHLSLYWQDICQLKYRFYGTFQYDDLSYKYFISVSKDFGKGKIKIEALSPKQEEMGAIEHYRIIDCEALKSILHDQDLDQGGYRSMIGSCEVDCQDDYGLLGKMQLEATALEVFPSTIEVFGHIAHDGHHDRFVAVLSKDFECILLKRTRYKE